jgi:hypothetical protein
MNVTFYWNGNQAIYQNVQSGERVSLKPSEILEPITEYVWYVKVDDGRYIIESDHWTFTTKEVNADLECQGILNWNNIKTGDTVYGSFTLENSGDLFSFLNWEITDYPSWGEWTFNPIEGYDLECDEEPVTVEIAVIAPQEEEASFDGFITIENKDDPSDFENIHVSLSTSKVRDINIFNLLIEKLVDRFPILHQFFDFFKLS